MKVMKAASPLALAASKAASILPPTPRSISVTAMVSNEFCSLPEKDLLIKLTPREECEVCKGFPKCKDLETVRRVDSVMRVKVSQNGNVLTRIY
jgi:hypothetical protein